MNTKLLMAVTLTTSLAACLSPEGYDPPDRRPQTDTEFETMRQPPRDREPLDDRRHELCAGDNVSSLCEAQPDPDDWGTALILSELILEGTDDDPVCCSDIDGDGDIDNSAGQAFYGLFGGGFETAEDRIRRGDDAVVLERTGRGDDLVVQWWPAMLASGAEHIEPGLSVAVLPYAIDSGRKSRYEVSGVVVSGDRLTGTGGVVEIPIVLFGIPLRVEAEVYEWTMTRGVPPEPAHGQMAVYASFADVYRAFNRAARACSHPESEVAAVNEDGVCQLTDFPRCNTAPSYYEDLAEACERISIIEIFADLDLDGDGHRDALSGGYTFEAVSARIEGIATDPGQ